MSAQFDRTLGSGIRRAFGRNLVVTLAVCSLASWIFYEFRVPLGRAVLTSFALGISVLGSITVGFALFKPSPRREPLLLFVTILVGTLLGVAINLMARSRAELYLLFSEYPTLVWRTGAFLFIFTSIITALIVWRERTTRLEIAYHAEHAKNHAQEKQLVEAQLKMLQAQIEPHFLFNTLANVQSLIDVSPAQAKAMLGHFNDYLRASLARTRDSGGSLQQELDLLRAYLSILQIRMAERLEYQINCPENLANLPLPPMLIQPLVENAVKHGLEPKVEGGLITIDVTLEQNKLLIRVGDNGLGLPTHVKSSGVGLANVRARLATLYGDRGRLSLTAGTPTGVIALLQLPMDEPKP